MTASPTARELAAACVHVEARGVLRHVRIVPPGTDPAQGVHWATSSEAGVRHHVQSAIDLLAPFVDLGLARRRLTPPTGDAHPADFFGMLADAPLAEFPSADALGCPREVALAHDLHDDDDGDPG